MEEKVKLIKEDYEKDKLSYQSAGLIDIREMEYFMDWKENEFGYDADYTTEQLLTIFRNQNL